MTSEIKHTVGDDDQRRDEVRAEPVIFLALVEQHLQRADAERQQSDADVVQFDAQPP